MLPAITRRTALASSLALLGGLRIAYHNTNTTSASSLAQNYLNSFRNMTTFSAPTAAGTLAAAPQIAPRRWYERGHAFYPGFLRSFHSFSFSNYHDYDHMGFSDLRVINEDRVEPNSGFPTHPHANAEIFSYIISGELTHKDSMGNIETLKRGDLQFTRAGSGVSARTLFLSATPMLMFSPTSRSDTLSTTITSPRRSTLHR